MQVNILRCYRPRCICPLTLTWHNFRHIFLSSVLLAIQSEEDSSLNPNTCSPSEVSYRLLLDNGAIVILTIYLVYPEPSSRSAQQEPGHDDTQSAAEFSWSLVTRGEMIVLINLPTLTHHKLLFVCKITARRAAKGPSCILCGALGLLEAGSVALVQKRHMAKASNE